MGCWGVELNSLVLQACRCTRGKPLRKWGVRLIGTQKARGATGGAPPASTTTLYSIFLNLELRKKYVGWVLNFIEAIRKSKNGLFLWNRPQMEEGIWVGVYNAGVFGKSSSWKGLFNLCFEWSKTFGSLEGRRGKSQAGEIARATKGTWVEIYQGMSHWETTLEGSVVFLHVLRVRHRMLLYSRLSLQGCLCREQLGRQK